MQVDGTIMQLIAIGSLIFNVTMVIIQARIKSDISELKAHMYEHFATKRELQFLRQSRRDDY